MFCNEGGWAMEIGGWVVMGDGQWNGLEVLLWWIGSGMRWRFCHGEEQGVRCGCQGVGNVVWCGCQGVGQ